MNMSAVISIFIVQSNNLIYIYHLYIVSWYLDRKHFFLILTFSSEKISWFITLLGENQNYWFITKFVSYCLQQRPVLQSSHSWRSLATWWFPGATPPRFTAPSNQKQECPTSFGWRMGNPWVLTIKSMYHPFLCVSQSELVKMGYINVVLSSFFHP